MTQQIVILRTMYPEPDLKNSNKNWLVQWSTLDSTSSKWFETFEDVSRFVEGGLLGGENL